MNTVICDPDLLSSALVAVGQLGWEGHVELVVGDVAEATARGRRLVKPGAPGDKSNSRSVSPAPEPHL